MKFKMGGGHVLEVLPDKALEDRMPEESEFTGFESLDVLESNSSDGARSLPACKHHDVPCCIF